MDVSGIAGNTEEIAVVDQFESGHLDLRPDQRFVRTVQGFDDARARAGFGRVIAHDQFAARLRLRPPGGRVNREPTSETVRRRWPRPGQRLIGRYRAADRRNVVKVG